MSSPIQFNFTQARGTTDRVSVIVDGMRTNIEEIKQLKETLLTEFKGAAAGGYTEVTNILQAKLDAYERSLGKLNGEVIRTSVDGGDMDVTDKSVGASFH
ncbi:hypothetical protein ACFQZZ_24300 [Nocardia sp. GCM10030253]|uniref:hypothetical protein n=1 Tax=Nocardia sp. GCM10030253 TaxID=3273404 RepID=UPI00364437A4